jgi:hypothetical protein
MGLKWWLIFLAQCLVRLIILVVWVVALIRYGRAYPQAAGVLIFLVMLDVHFFFRASQEERKRKPRFFEWFPLGDGIYMAWKARNRGGRKLTI